MLRKFLALGVVVSLLACAGCTAFAMGDGVVAAIGQTRSPVAVGDTSVSAMKMGRATQTGILLVAMGDSSITTAAANAGITKIHHVDSEVLNVLGIFATQTTIVYGE